MVDKISAEQRSKTMQAVKDKDSGIELALRRALSQRGHRYRKNVSRLPGKPDIAFINKKTAIFVDSCFWHGCPYHCRMPSSNIRYWRNKIKRNKERDKEIRKIYAKKGWKILRFWEHELKKDLNKVVAKIEKSLQ